MTKLLCSKCRAEKDTSLFTKRHDAARGYEYHCKACRSEAAKKHKAGNLIAAAKWKAANREYTRIKARERQKNKPEQAAACRRAYEARKINAMPAWADVALVRKKYEQMVAWNQIWPDDPVHVDHIIPLTSKLVCGLHVHTNLQILRAVENMKKHNKLIHE